ncbi:MAG: hypothetical protein JWO31_2907 [Phycisphaerales bacterium]|nr:hypothetical protein [Phycisphaerales bacterium]
MGADGTYNSVMASPIQIDPEVMHGVPCFAGTRVPVKALFDLLARARTIDYFLLQFPTVKREQVVDVLAMAGERLPVLASEPAA